MPKNITALRARSRELTKAHKMSIAGVAALGCCALAVTAAPSEAQSTVPHAAPAAAAQVELGNQPAKQIKASITDQMAASALKAEAIAAKQKAAAAASAKKAAPQQAAAQPQRPVAQRPAQQAASRSAERPQVRQAAPAPKSYANNVDGWIRQSLDIMAQKGIPGSYNGLYRNIMRESSGNPMAINNWDINAQNGIPSKGLLQVIQPTFNAYHVEGTSWNIYDPVANITAACNYAAHRYGSMDNVNSAY
ncbi:transglycosylase SLT domain-containing protein [Streptomyces glomeratus]|uniref:Transglycosylase SLT domain-containing protein n=1 Tax=Streptomyces glomeratus TaxID=284452 RepID=A0ABP6LD23_9ACTN|nr:transglycosylase SLT domain-containing protein [Streptomyces glomeratus]MCF1509931.1 transglycosylase SLT domain-containing protein [Streptomyces glomeratus]